MSRDVAAIVERYAQEFETFRRAASKTEKRVLEIADSAGIQCRVAGRAKDPRSLHKKILLKGYTDPWRQVTDKVGVRAIVYVPSDVDRLCDELKATFGQDVLNVDDKRIPDSVNSLSYAGVHMQVVAQRPRGGDPIECEIQVRTTTQDAWSVFSHKALYKPVVSLPPELQRAAYRLLALVELFDSEVQRIMDALAAAPGSEVVDLIQMAEVRFLPLAHSPSNPAFSAMVLQAIADCFDEVEQGAYEAILDAFIDAERSRIKGLFEEYGAHSIISYAPDYVLFGQAESLILLERLSEKPHKVVARWRASGLPESYLRTFADAAGISLP